jgi:hypothetical protein
MGYAPIRSSWYRRAAERVERQEAQWFRRGKIAAIQATIARRHQATAALAIEGERSAAPTASETDATKS